MKDRSKSSGNVFFLLFAAVGMTGVVALSMQHYVLSPLKTASTLTRKNAAETQMQLGVRVAASNAVVTQANAGNCDADSYIEPLPFKDPTTNPYPIGGGLLPDNIGNVKSDPWKTLYGYCAWDHGANLCGVAGRLAGTNSQEWDTMAVISAGPDRVFQTTCNAWADVNADLLPDTPLVNKPATSDDIYYSWSYQDASAGSGGLWTLETTDTTTAEIRRNLSVKDVSDAEQLAFDTVAKALTIGAGGRGDFPSIKADFIQLYTATNPSIQLLDAIRFSPEDGSGTTFTLQNATGDDLRFNDGAFNMLTLNSVAGVAESVKFNVTSNPSTEMSYDTSVGGRPKLILRSPADAAVSTNILLRSTLAAGTVNKTNRIEGQHRSTNLSDTPTNRIDMGILNTGSRATASDIAGYIDFQTRPLGLSSVSSTFSGQLYISSNGFVRVGLSPLFGLLNANTVYLTLSGSEKVGLGVLPTASSPKLSINGAIILPGNPSACSTSNANGGAIYYDSVKSCLQMCDGIQYTCINNTGCSSSTPNLFSFTDVPTATGSTSYDSNIVQITGLGSCRANMRISAPGGVGIPTYRVCSNGTSDANCSASIIKNWSSIPLEINWPVISDNQWIQLRQTSSAFPGRGQNITVTVGGRSDTWSVTTQGDCSVPSPAVGTFCADGTIYMGLSPDSLTKMYTTPCSLGSVWTGTSCSDSLVYPWSAGATIVTGITNNATGEANTIALSALTNSNAPYVAALACDSLDYGGQNDWYLPSLDEAMMFRQGCPTNLIVNVSCTDSVNRFSSTESSSSLAKAFRYNSTLTNITQTKTTATPIRCVRKD